MTEPLLLRAKLATNWFDQELADLICMRRSTVQAMICGRRPEHLADWQRKALIDAVRDFVSESQEQLDAMELFG